MALFYVFRQFKNIFILFPLITVNVNMPEIKLNWNLDELSFAVYYI